MGPAGEDCGSGMFGNGGQRAKEEQGGLAGPAARQRVLLPRDLLLQDCGSSRCIHCPCFEATEYLVLYATCAGNWKSRSVRRYTQGELWQPITNPHRSCSAKTHQKMQAPVLVAMPANVSDMLLRGSLRLKALLAQHMALQNCTFLTIWWPWLHELFCWQA